MKTAAIENKGIGQEYALREDEDGDIIIMKDGVAIAWIDTADDSIHALKGRISINTTTDGSHT